MHEHKWCSKGMVGGLLQNTHSGTMGCTQEWCSVTHWENKTHGGNSAGRMPNAENLQREWACRTESFRHVCTMPHAATRLAQVLQYTTKYYRYTRNQGLENLFWCKTPLIYKSLNSLSQRHINRSCIYVSNPGIPNVNVTTMFKIYIIIKSWLGILERPLQRKYTWVL